MQITIRMNGSKDEVEIDGHTFDRSTLSTTERNTMAEMIRAALFDPMVTRKPRKPRKHRRNRRRKGA